MAFIETIKWLNSLGETVDPADNIDTTCQANKEVSMTEHAINKGLLFESFSKFSLASSGTYKMAITTPAATKIIHWIPTKIVTTGPKITVSFYYDLEYTGGTALVAYNHNFNSVITSSLAIKTGVTCTLAGNPFAQVFLGGGTGVGQSRSGAETTITNKWILKPAKNFIFVIENAGSAEEIIQINNSWIEKPV